MMRYMMMHMIMMYMSSCIKIGCNGLQFHCIAYIYID